jgi:hypothetical protein
MKSMGIRLKNIITDYTSEMDSTIVNEIKKSFQFIQVKRFDDQFQGIVGQINEVTVERNCDNAEFLEKNNCKELEDVFEIIACFEDKVIDFSEKFPKKSFAFIDVDCFGGVCSYNGFVVKNGEILNNENGSNGHIQLLKQLNPNFKEWYFEPFSRDFFIKKGDIKGEIKNFSIAALWLALKKDYPNGRKYYIDGGANSLILRCHNKYYYYFTTSNQNIEITGVIYNDEEKIINEIVDIPDNSFRGLVYELEINFSEKNYVVNKTSRGNS